MRKVTCYTCGKSYDYDEDGFCPNCGAFNQPRHASTVSSDGSVVRVDGLNEKGHAGSFLHREFHEENRERRTAGLEYEARRIVQNAAGTLRKNVSASRKKASSPWKAIGWVIGAIVVANVLLSLLQSLFWFF